MVTEVEMTVWIQSVWSCETVKDQIYKQMLITTTHTTTTTTITPNQSFCYTDT